jgi:two-component system CheB/CheR fusion protein
MTTEQKATNSESYIVGIGASAGGMEALHELFDNTPADTGFSYVVIQHLSPDYKSLMSELLAKHTMMPVIEAGDNMRAEPNTVYVIPAKKLLTIKNGHLKLVTKEKNHHPNNAVDVFFESLAEEAREKAIAIVLSGTGTDGTKGIAAVKKNNGLVIVQDPVSAAFDGMPNSAIASGCADMVLPPEMISDELIEYLKDIPVLKKFTEFNQRDESILRDLLNGVKQVTGNDFTHYKRPTLFRRLAKRMSELSCKTLDDYKHFISDNQDELKSLGREFLINVTKFFRDTEAFDFLRVAVLPEIIANKKDKDTIKVWSMACSTGEEAYSIAIMFYELLGRERINEMQVKIFATDIDAQALDTASKGVYSAQIEKEVSPDLLEKYFVKDGSHYRVTSELRRLVVFAKHDILKDPPLSKVDLVLCRNMLIYFDSYLQAKVLHKIHFALNVDSYLFLGSSENIGALGAAMKEVSRKWKIFRCTTKTNVIESNVFVMPFGNKVNMMPGAPNTNPLKDVGELFKDTITEFRTIAGILIDKEFNVKHAVGNFKHFLQFPEEVFQFNLLKMVHSDLSVALGVHIRKSISTDEPVIARNVIVHEGKESRAVNVVIKPYLHSKNYTQPFLFVILEEAEKAGKKLKRPELTLQDHTEQLERELRESRESLQAIIEELESANEELQSNNEEMISTNEELQSTNEELQSLNEELHTVSAEHQSKIKELLDLNDDLDNYFRNSDTGQVFVDNKLLVRKFSPTIAPIINLISTDIGRSLVDITYNIDDRNFINDIKQVIRHGEKIEKEVKLDNNRYFLARISPYWKRDKTIDGAVINFTDISESKKLSGIIEAIVNSSTNGISAKKAIRDKSGKIVDFEFLTANATYCNMFGKVAAKIIGRPVTQVFPGVTKEYIARCASVVETGKPEKTENYLEEQDKWYESVIVQLDDGIVTTHTDVTEKKKAAELISQSYHDLQNTSQQLIDSNMQLERSNMDLMQFASVASHDLKEPLRKIQVFGNILTERLEGKFSEQELNYLTKITSASQRMQVLIEDVLTLSKLSNSELPRVEVDLKGTITRILDDLEITISERKAIIQVSELPVIHGVPGQIHQVFQNLISNALKFNDKKTPRISITAKDVNEQVLAEICPGSDPADFVMVEVTDNGIGFEEQYTDKIFGIFQRLNGRQFDGTGIGLAIVKKIIENHGGGIKANSEPGKWTTFCIFLPK